MTETLEDKSALEPRRPGREWPERLSGWGWVEGGIDWLSLATIDQLSAPSVRESVRIQFSCGLFNESAPWCFCKGIGPKSDRVLKRPVSFTVQQKEDGAYNVEFNLVGQFAQCAGDESGRSRGRDERRHRLHNLRRRISARHVMSCLQISASLQALHIWRRFSH